MVPTLSTIYTIYDYQATCEKIKLYKVAHPYYTNVRNALKHLFFKFDAAHLNVNDNDVYLKLKYLNFRMVFYPLPFNYHSELINELDVLISSTKDAYPYAIQELDKIQQELLPQLSYSPDNPLLEQIIKMRDIHGDIHVLLYSNANLLQAVREFFQQPGLEQLNVIRETQYLGLDTYNHVIVIGPPMRFSTAVFQSRRSPSMSFVYVQGASHRLPSSFMIAEYPALPNSPLRDGNDVVQDDQDDDEESQLYDLSSTINWARIVTDSADDGNRHDSDIVEANVVQFEGGLYTYVDSNPDQGIQALDIYQLVKNPEDAVFKLSRRKMRPGLHILMRTDENTDYIEAVADKILGYKSKKLRASLSRWKKGLFEYIQHNGIVATIQALLNFGATSTAQNQNNVLRWARMDSIRPQDNQNMRAILQLLQYRVTEYDTVIKEAEAVQTAHIQAGQRVRTLLLESIAKNTTSAILNEPRIDFELKDIGATLSAFQIVEVSTRTVPISHWRLHKLFQE